MEITTTTKINDVLYQFKIDEKNEMDALNKAIILTNPPKFCQCCKNNKIFEFSSNKDKEGNIYVNFVCKNCYAKSKLGQYKTGGFFWHKFEKFEKNKLDSKNLEK